jgi:RHS repeat-associated protein
VTFGGVSAPVTSWNNTQIVVTVPSSLATGAYGVYVNVGGLSSGGVMFQVGASPSVSSMSPTSGPIGTSVTLTGANFGAAQGTSTVTFGGVSAPVTSWSNTQIVTTVPSGAATGNVVVVVVNVSGVNSTGVNFAVTGLPTGWSDQDVGTVGEAGSASYANGVFTVSGAGYGMMSYTTDGFHFAYQALSGDGTIVARLASTSNTYAQVGVMIRETLDAGATSMFVGDYATSIYTFVRTTTGGTPTSARNSGTVSLPYWVKLVRSGSTFTGYQSLDGLNWAVVGTSQTVSMAQNVYVGLAVSSGSTGALYTGTFDCVSINSNVNPAPVITSVSATTGSIGSQVVISGTNFGAPQGSGVVLLNGALVTVNSWSSTSITITIPNGATSGPLVVSVAPSMNDSNPVVFTVTSTPLPPGWLDQDIGQVGKAGSASYANGLFTIQGAGTGVSATACAIYQANPDSFHFVYQPLSGDGTIVARVASPTYLPGQAGIMIRETLDPNAKSVLVGEYTGSIFAWYRELGGGTAGCAQPQVGAPFPYWFKLERTGNSFSAFQSPDGFDWTPVGGTFAIDMAQTVYVGLAMSSLSTYLQTGYFDNISVSSMALAAPVITALSATTGPAGTQVVISGSGFGASRGSSAAVLNDAPMTINSWSATSITVTIPIGATSGVMAVLVAPSMDSSNGVVFTVTSQPLPSGWLDTDVGTVGTIGNASYANGVFTLQGAGAYLTAYADSFHFVYQPMSTSGTIIARVTGGTTGAHVGVMMRETLDAGSANLAASGMVESSYIASMYYRSFLAGYELSGGSQAVTEPYWLEVVRNVNQFSAYTSTDGLNWVQLGTTQTITTAQTVYVGLGVASMSYGNTDIATFDNVSVTLGGTLADPVITGISPTTGAPGAVVTINGSGFGATQGSSAVSFNGATATISSWSDAQIVAIVPNGAATGPVMVTVGGITAQGPMFSVDFTVQLTDSLGNQTTFVSSLEGGQYSYTSAQGSGCSSCTTRGTVQNEYDALGNVQAITDANGNITTYQYDSSNNLTSQSAQVNATSVATTTYTYNSFGEVLWMTDPLGFMTTNTYDSHGNLLTVTTPSGSVTTFTYDTKGELLTVKDPLNNVTTLTYTPVGLINTITDAQNNVTTYGYDSHGNRTSVTDALGHQTTFTYDAMDRLTQITYPDTTTTQFGYDYRGRRTSATDQNGKTTTYAYDDADRLITVTDAANNVTTYSYDTESNLTSIEDAHYNTTYFTYDAFGRVTKTTFPSGYIETYAYDADNNLTAKTDRKNQLITYTYDQLNRLTQKSYPDSSTVNYTYDLDSRLTQVIDPTGTYSFTFDNMGRLTGTTTSYTFLTRNFTTSYGYDAGSNRTSFTDPENGSSSYVYDTLNRLQTLTPPAAIGGSFGFAYNALSRRTSLTRPNTVSTSYSYDNLSRLLSVTHAKGGATLDGATYTVDSVGNRTAKNDLYVGVTTNYGYDAIYELLNATQAGATTESYTYDPVGNRLSNLTSSGWSYNTSNELTARPSVSYAYDANGNTIVKTDSTGTTNYTWDYENRLTSVTLPGSGGTVSFKYDPFWRRIYKSSASGVSIYAYDGDNLVEETNASGAAVARYSQGLNIDEPLAMLRSGTTSYYQEDGLGSVTSLTNSAGAAAQTYTYDSFGNLLAASGSLVNSFRYTGREFDTETNLYFYRARYYDPAAGRFLNEDPIGFRGGLDLYDFVLDNPMNMVDPFGLYPDPPQGPRKRKPRPPSSPRKTPPPGLALNLPPQVLTPAQQIHQQFQLFLKCLDCIGLNISFEISKAYQKHTIDALKKPPFEEPFPNPDPSPSANDIAGAAASGLLSALVKCRDMYPLSVLDSNNFYIDATTEEPPWWMP